MVRKLFQSLQGENPKTDLSRKIEFWAALLICGLLFFTHEANSSAISNAKNNNKTHEFFLRMNNTLGEFHDFIEELVSTNATNQFTSVDENGQTILHKAVQQFPVLNRTLDILKEFDVDFKVTDEIGNTAFFNAVYFGRNVTFLTTLISYGMEWNTRNKKNETALHVASLSGNLGAVKLLISLGSDVNAQNLGGRTPLHEAVVSKNCFQNSFEIVQELVIHGAITGISDKGGESVLHLAAANNHLERHKGEIIRYLIENHADVNAADFLGNTFLHKVAEKSTPAALHEMVAFLALKNITNPFFIKNDYGQTVLHKTVSFMEVWNETLEILQKCGVDFNAVDAFGRSVLFSGISGGWSDSFLKNLIAFGANWRLKDYQQNTVLHMAAERGNLAALKLFIQLGADVNAVNKFGETPLYKTIAINKSGIANELVLHGANDSIINKLGQM